MAIRLIPKLVVVRNEEGKMTGFYFTTQEVNSSHKQPESATRGRLPWRKNKKDEYVQESGRVSKKSESE